MRTQPIEELLPMSNGSIYKLVRMASKRAMELSEGKPSLLKDKISDKETTTALEEIKQRKVFCKESEEEVERLNAEALKEGEES